MEWFRVFNGRPCLVNILSHVFSVFSGFLFFFFFGGIYECSAQFFNVCTYIGVRAMCIGRLLHKHVKYVLLIMKMKMCLRKILLDIIETTKAILCDFSVLVAICVA